MMLAEGNILPWDIFDEAGYTYDHERVNVYLAGPINDYEAADRTRERVKGKCPDGGVNWFDPYEREMGENSWQVKLRDLACIYCADAVFVYYPSGCDSWGTQLEMLKALEWGKPVVVWDMDDGENSVWLNGPFFVEDDLIQAFYALLTMTMLKG